jgi:ATP-dependent Clp protease protease subunit
MRENRRSFILVNEFTEESAAQFKQELIEQSMQNIMAPIVVHIDSYGGYVDSLAMMIEAMEYVPNPIITVAIGKAFSCGAMLLAAGDVRFCGRHSRVMVHELSGGAQGDVNEVFSNSVQLKDLNRYWMSYLAKKCKIKGGYAGIKKLLNKSEVNDVYFTPEQALNFGIVDYIGLPAVIENVTYDITIIPERDKRN